MQLIRSLQELKGKNGNEVREEMQSIIDAAGEVMEAMKALNTKSQAP